MKVLIFTTHFSETSGYERLAVELAIELNRQGVSADILSQYDREFNGGEEREANLRKKGLRNIHYLGLPPSPSFLGIVRAIIRLRQLIKENKYTALEVSGNGNVILSALALLDIPLKILAGVHDIVDAKILSSPKGKLFKLVVSCMDSVSLYGISNAASDSAKKVFGLKHVPTVYNSINNLCFWSGYSEEYQSRYIQQELEIKETTKCILFAGRLMRRKGIDTLYEAMVETLVESNIHLVFVGRIDDSEDLRDPALLEEIKRNTIETGTHTHIHWLGERADLFKIMQCCDVLVHPARKEGFGLVLAEALAAGLPIVASKVGGIPELLSNTHSVLIEPDNPHALRKALLEMLSWTENKRREAIKLGRLRAKYFSVERRATSIIRLIKYEL